ncbi:MAG: hypothetical protein ACRD29_18930 [Acidimicrobiales bacterium]
MNGRTAPRLAGVITRIETTAGALVVLLVAGFILGACGSDGDHETTDTTGATRTTETVTPAEVPDGRDAIVAQFSTGGGIAGPCCPFWDVPEMTAYGDGRVVFVEGTVGQVPGMREARISRSDLADLLADAQAAGLLTPEGPDTGAPCCDLGYTRLILGEGTTTHELSIMGLGFEHVDDDLSDEQRRTRQAVTDLRARLRSIAEDSDRVGGYAPEELAVLVLPGSRAPGVEPTPWPLDHSLADGGNPAGHEGRCLHVTNLDTGAARAVLAAARQATSATWSSAGQEWTVLIRPLLPHEHACPSR